MATNMQASKSIAQLENVDEITIEAEGTSEPIQKDEKMVPKPYDDLFIEPADDYDVVYGDYNATIVVVILSGWSVREVDK
ncbi:unnamed protein product [Toxocara canis]|uniref:Tudor domain-containing protein n=1 Tax=Toxocara canis TaxID=6265 RepID=A0A183V7E9_TOXCA|nr:unnamed protein product [Toxocara canis]